MSERSERWSGPHVIVRLTRLRNSIDGNPSFRVHLVDGLTLRTRANSYAGFDVQNPALIDAPVDLLLTAQDTIRAIRPHTA